MILRLLGLVYAVAFLVAINQIVPLIGSHGLLPLDNYFGQVKQALYSGGAAFVKLPSVFWFWRSDAALLFFAWLGFVLSLLVVAGFANMPVMGILWFVYMSFVHAGQDWYGYGWEIQLTETGFLAIFLCPLWDMRPFSKRPPPLPVIILFRWLIFRIMLGSAMIKLRGDASWRNATALNQFFETQPIPGPFSRWFHFLPRIVLKIGVWYNWLAELVAPWFIFWPRMARHIAGIIIIGLQVALLFGGNLSFLNWLTVVPALACFDDGFWVRILPTAMVKRAQKAAADAEEPKPMMTTTWIVTALVGLLSIQPVINLFSPQQIMNTSFDPLDLVNTYGAFGTVGQERYNIIFEGTYDRDTTKANWTPYLYKGLPVLPNQRPPQIAPYQPRLDWQMWFAAMGSPQEYPWTYNLIWKLLHNDGDAISLFANNPFPNGPPRYIRAELYRYKFAPPGNPTGLWWTRERVGDWIQPFSANNPMLTKYIVGMGWNK